MTKKLFTFFILFYASVVCGQEILREPDVTKYKAFIHPNFSQKSVQGHVTIRFEVDEKTKSVSFNSGNLQVSKFIGKGIIGMEQKNKETILTLKPNDSNTYSVQLFYTGSPVGQGMKINSEYKSLYTVFSTSDWMICNSSPSDKALLEMAIVVPNDLTCVASGTYSHSTPFDSENTLQSWIQDYETPSYTYGIAIGNFQKSQQQHKGKTLNYFGANYSSQKLAQIFQYTGRMIDFFEEKTGLPLPQNTYSQVLIGKPYQEMSGFAILKQSYGRLVLKDSTETNLISHELAHQWWGNRITCKNWRHFWLNEGFATYLSAAINEELFGNEKYMKDINSYKRVYQGIKAKGLDKSLVFKNWDNPSNEDRSLVYFKGAYVLHLLREDLGDELFWNGIKHYSQKFIGQSVVTKDFQTAMEEASEVSLQSFFDKWVY